MSIDTLGGGPLTPKWGVARFCPMCGDRYHGFHVHHAQAAAKAQYLAIDCGVQHAQHGESTTLKFCMDCGQEHSSEDAVRVCTHPHGTDEWYA